MMIQFGAGVVLSVGLAVVAGCVSASSRPVALPNGHQGYAIHCHGARHDMSGCMNEAGKICGGPYYIVNQFGQVIGGSEVVSVSGPVHVNGFDHRFMVECLRRQG